MKIKGKEIKIKALCCLALYYTIAYHLPDSYSFLGKIPNAMRVALCKNIFKKCGHIRTINRHVMFGSGRNIEMGDESGIGANTQIPQNTIIGSHVMISRNVFILSRNHEYSDITRPINNQGFRPFQQTVIEDDCWIGMNSLLTPGRIVRKGTIVGMGSVLTKDFPEYSVVGGNPAKFIKSRKTDI